MGYVYFNPNPRRKSVGDCVIRGVSAVTGQDWDASYIDMADMGFIEKDMPSSNDVLGKYLALHGFEPDSLPNTCLLGRCYSVKQFCKDHPYGTFLLATGTHVVAVIDGDYYDAWDSGNEVPIYYWRKENDDGTLRVL